MTRARAVALGLVLAACAGRRDPVHIEDQLEREVQALNQVVRDLRTQAEGCELAGGPDTIYADLHQVYAGTEIAVEREGSTTVVSLPITVLFTDVYGLRFREEANMTLDLLATALRLHPGYLIEIQGHSDDALLPRDLVRRYGSHLDLSFQYAAAVMQKLSEDFGVPEARFTVSARGQWAPIASNDVAIGQQRNRRVEIRIRPGPGDQARP